MAGEFILYYIEVVFYIFKQLFKCFVNTLFCFLSIIFVQLHNMLPVRRFFFKKYLNENPSIKLRKLNWNLRKILLTWEMKVKQNKNSKQILGLKLTEKIKKVNKDEW